MPFYHLKILAHFNHARNELLAAEELLADMMQQPDEINQSFGLQLSREVFIEIRRIEYLIRKELKRIESSGQET